MQFKEISIVWCHSFFCSFTFILWVMVQPLQVKPEHQRKLFRFSWYPTLCNILSVSQLVHFLKLHELWLAISAIMYPPCIIHALWSFWKSPKENTRGESHPSPTKPTELVLWWEWKNNVEFLIIQTLEWFIIDEEESIGVSLSPPPPRKWNGAESVGSLGR